MFVEKEKRPAGDFPLSREQRIGSLTLSEAIRKGKQIVVEGTSTFRMCAIGCAFAGVRGREMTQKELADYCGRGVSNEDVARLIGKDLGFSEASSVEVHKLHFKYRMPALQIATQLESQGL